MTELCDGDCPRCLDPNRAPEGVEHVTPDGIFIKEMKMAKAGTPVFQHAHTYAHTSFLARGSVRVWVNGQEPHNYQAPAAIFIEAKVLHEFLALEDDTLVLCLHNTGGNWPAIHREHTVEVSV